MYIMATVLGLRCTLYDAETGKVFAYDHGAWAVDILRRGSHYDAVVQESQGRARHGENLRSSLPPPKRIKKDK